MARYINIHSRATIHCRLDGEISNRLAYVILALSLLAAGCASSPDVAHFKEGVAFAKSGQLNEAAAAYAAALEANPGQIEARLNLGTVLYKQGRLTQAEREFRLVLSQDPEHVAARENLATTLEAKGGYDEEA